MSTRIDMASRCAIRPAEVLQQMGFGQPVRRKLRRFQRTHEQQGAAVVLLHWPDGTWCVLAQHAGPLAHVIALDDDLLLAAYEDARSMLHSGHLPKLVARFQPYP
ncbi:hypothetical protein ACYCFK_03195 [Stutzerimonas stutzeri]